MYIRKALFRNAISVISLNGLGIPLPSSQCVLEKSFPHVYISIHLYVHIYEELFSKTWTQNLMCA